MMNSTEDMRRSSFYVVGYNMSNGEAMFHRTIDNFEPFEKYLLNNLSKTKKSS